MIFFRRNVVIAVLVYLFVGGISEFSLGQTCGTTGTTARVQAPQGASSLTGLTTGGGTSYLYFLTAYGAGRVSLSNPAVPSGANLAQVGLKFNNGGVVPMPCDCWQMGRSFAAAESADGSSRTIFDNNASTKAGGLAAQVARATGSGGMDFGQQANVTLPSGGTQVAAIALPGGKFIGYNPSEPVEVVDMTTTNSNPDPAAALRPIGTFPWSGGFIRLKAVHIQIPLKSYDKYLLFAAIGGSSSLQVAEINPNTGLLGALPGSVTTSGEPAVIDVAVVNDKIFLFIAEGNSGLRFYEYIPSLGQIVLRAAISGYYNNVIARGGQFPVIFGHRVVSGTESWVDLFGSQFLNQGTAPPSAPALSLRQSGSSDKFIGGVFEAVISGSTGYLYRLAVKTGSETEDAIHTTPLNVSCLTADTTSPPTASASATNVSAQLRGDGVNYYGDKWQLQDTSTSGVPITHIDWDFNYIGSFSSDESGTPAAEGTVIGYFPCDPNGLAAGSIRTGANCIQSLGLTNPPATGTYRFALQSQNANGPSPSPFISTAAQVVCPQANILGYTGFTGSCAKSGGTLNVLTGGNADASGSKGNLADATVQWDFTGSTPISVQGQIVPVPSGASGFTLTMTFPGGYRATASGTVVQTSLVAAFTTPSPVLKGSAFNLTNQMQKASSTVLNSVDYLIASGACGVPPPIATNPLAPSFLNAGGLAPVTAPAQVGSYCIYLKYNFTPQGSAATSQTVGQPLTVTDWAPNPSVGVYQNNDRTGSVCFTLPCPLTTGTNYYLFDVEAPPPAGVTYPGAQWFLAAPGVADSLIGSSPAGSVGPVTANFSSACSTGCSLKVLVGTGQSSFAVSISIPVTPPPTPVLTPVPTPTPTSGSISVDLQGPNSGSRGATLTFTASASGGVTPYNYFWACDYNPIFPVFSPAGQTTTCNFSTSGVHIVKAKVIDGAGTVGYSLDYSVSITGVPSPSGDYTVVSGAQINPLGGGAYNGTAGVAVVFQAVENNAASYSWDFGDGGTSTAKSPSHTYADVGSYAVRLTVAGDGTNTSGTSSGTKTFNIGAPAIPLPSAAYTVAGATPIGTDAYEVEAGRSVLFTASEVSSNAKDYAWDFGDGTTDKGKSVTKSWNAVAARTVRLTVTGDGTNRAGTASANKSFNVIPVKFQAIIVPGAAHLDLGTSVWGTDVSVSNPGTDSLTITPNFIPYTDAPSDTLDVSQIPYDSRLSFQLSPGASWSQVDIVKFLKGGSNKGTLVFKYEGSADPVVTARVYFASASDPQGASYGAAFPSYKITGGGGLSTQETEETDQAVTSEQTLIGLRSNDLYRFRVTLFNADSKAGTFRLFAYDQANNPQFIKDANGQLVGFREFKIGPFQQASPNDDDLGLKDPATRYVLKASRAPNTTTGALIAFGTALDRKTSDLVQIADDTPATVAESGVINYYVAGVSHLDTQRAQWRTDLRIFNKSASKRILGFEYYYTKGAGSPEQKAQVVSVEIPGNGLLTYDDVVDSLMKRDGAANLAGDNAGMLRIFHFEDSDSSTKPLVISSRNYDDPSDGSGTAGTQLAVYSSSQTSKPGAASLVVPGAEDSERFYSVVGLFTPDSTLTSGRISAIGADGKEIGFYDFVLNQENGFGRFGQIFLRSLKDPANPNSPASIPTTPVTIRVTVTGGGRVGGYAVTVDLKTNDLTFVQGRPQP